MTHSHDRSIPKHRMVYENLRAAIVSGQYRVGDRIPSETALVKKFSLSRPTVARAMKDLESVGLVERRHGSGTYVLHANNTSGGTLGLLVSGFGQGEIFEPICRQIARSAQQKNFSLLWGDFSVDNLGNPGENLTRRTEQICQHYISSRVAGVFFQPIELSLGMEEANQRIANLLQKSGIPVVLIDCDFSPYPTRSQFDLAGIDNQRVGYVQCEHLLKLGRQRIHYICRSRSAHTIGTRIHGYRQALFDHDVAWNREWTHEIENIGVDDVKSILDKHKPDAFVCGNDYTAACLMRDLLKLGVRIPEDVALIGIDNQKYANALSVPITTIQQPCVAIGDAAVDLMTARIENPSLPVRSVNLDFELVVRESCGSHLVDTSS